MNPAGESTTRTSADARANPRRKPKRLLLFLASILALAGVAVGIHFIREELRAQSHKREAQAAIDRRDFKTALKHLARCREAWPSNGEIAFLSARTTRRAGDLEGAERLLIESRRLGWPEDDVTLETGLLLAERGQFALVEPYLLGRVRAGHPDSHLIAEVIGPIYVKIHNAPMATEMLELWGRKEPANHLPHLLLGDLSMRLGRDNAAQASLAEAFRLAPDDPAVREKYGILLAATNNHAEAKRHLEWVVQRGSASLSVRLNLAHCWAILGEENKAREMLDALILEAPLDGRIIAERGRIELEDGKPEQAATYLKKAYELLPYEVMICHNYARCLDLLRKPKEAETIREHLRKVRESLKRIQELMRVIASSPTDPVPRREAGLIMMRNGQEAAGIRWLETALEADPKHGPTHQDLADYYEKKGDDAKAFFHRRFASSKSP